MSSPYTPEQIRDQFLTNIENLVDEWASYDGLTDKDKLEGLVHSIFALIDGATLLPAFRIVVDPGPEDFEYRKNLGEQWYPSCREIELPGDITDRKLFYQYLRHEWGSRRPAKY